MEDPFVYQLNEHRVSAGPVFYWMNRDQRVADNRALFTAQRIALELKQPLAVVFCLAKSFLGATDRHYRFMCGGLKSVANLLETNNIPFILLHGNPDEEMNIFFNHMQPGAVVTDFSPLRLPMGWKRQVADKLQCAMWEVDAHNIVACRAVSQKLEFGAYTLRPKLHRALPDPMPPLPQISLHPFSFTSSQKESFPAQDWAKCSIVATKIGDGDAIVGLPSGEHAAHEKLADFLENRILRYEQRNDPNVDAASGLSPYLHFGQIFAGRILLAVRNEQVEGAISAEVAADFLEQLVVRRELSDNFCLYNPQYDTTKGFHPWATKTLDEHRGDMRTWRYSKSQLEDAATHDPLWNAAQMQMVKTGCMHGYMRMYWAKKILEWSADPEEAMASAIYLNDTWSLDGRDPNGYTGIAWSIGGVHDRAWGERPVYGKIRYMSYDGCKRKFDIARYIKSINGLEA